VKRPDWDEYLMGIALAVRRRANCTGNRVGAVMVQEQRIVATGYNGTPADTENCEDGGCERCADRAHYESGRGYDLCICVHAEQNCLLSAARFGIAVEGGTLYTTMRPCFGCTKELLQAGVVAVRYLHEWRHPDEGVWTQYQRLQARFPRGVKRVIVEDPDREWAVTLVRTDVSTGHTE